VLWSVLLAVAAGCWLWCQLADPSVVQTSCLVLREHEGHYCAICRKAIPGLDHQ
jgi:hypothetical protein